MRTLFRSVVFVVMVAAGCLALFSSCSNDEKYDFVFKLQGQIVSELSKTITVPFTARNIVSVSVASQPKGWTVNSVDMKNFTISVTAPLAYTADDGNVVENGILKLTGYTAAGTTVTATSYLSLLNQEIDLTHTHSNCYVISQKDTRYTIDVTYKGESNERVIAPDSVALMWQSVRKLVDFSSYDANSGTFTFFVSHEDITDDEDNVIDTKVPDGSAVVAAYGNEGKVLWSWHIWVTGSDVESSAIETSVGTFMDRNLGAYHNSDGSVNSDDIYRSYGLYYQWGRKDPFARPIDYKFSANTDKSVYRASGDAVRVVYTDVNTKPEAGSVEFATAHPMHYMIGSANNDYDWLYTSHDATLWTSGKKSIYDPCPKGWRVPDAGVWEAFDIDQAEDSSALVDVRNMYGWHLVDKATGVKMFMPGAGRKSFQNGVLTNVNNYGFEHNPMPWVGYYWTTGTASGNMSESMFFDLNTTRATNNRYEAKKPMYRANAMQIRCVRE